jgi:hypothetical protein
MPLFRAIISKAISVPILHIWQLCLHDLPIPLKKINKMIQAAESSLAIYWLANFNRFVGHHKLWRFPGNWWPDRNLGKLSRGSAICFLLDYCISLKLTVLRNPAIGTSIVVWEFCLQSFESHVSRTHNGLIHVVEAMDHVPVVIFRQGRIGSKPRVCFNNGKETMKLMRHWSCEDGSVWPDDRGR